MISINYIRGSKTDMLYNEILESTSYINSHINSPLYDTFTKYDEKFVIEHFDLVTENVFEKIGDVVKKVVSKFIELVDSLITNVKEALWGRKTDMQKIEAIVKKNPVYGEQIKMAFLNGDLDIKDIKSMQDLMDGTYDIMEKLRTGKLKPEVAKTNFEKLKDKFIKGTALLATVAGGIKLAGGAVEGFDKMIKFREKLITASADAKTLKLKAKSMQANLDAMNTTKDENGNTVVLQRSMMTSALSMIGGNLTKMNGLAAKLGNKIKTIADAHTTKIGIKQAQQKATDAAVDYHNAKLAANGDGGAPNTVKSNFAHVDLGQILTVDADKKEKAKAAAAANGSGGSGSGGTP